ncbi:MAG: SDR family NAD(P)-dependent oxidoreductase [Gluconacetobacter diazotrophicus]|nr:SDR family NAD(P)-dependent oxidoreductase [Gluconacetobacter diazotrophicus]
MAELFGAHSTTDQVLAGRSLAGRRVLVTGVSAGLGVETARALAARGAEVVGTARDPAKAERATVGVRAAAAAGGGSFAVAKLDLADLADVRRCADRLLSDGRPFDVLVNNAGVMATPFERTADGFELQFGTNHLGHFALTSRLLPLLRDGGRVVALSSAGHRYADVDLDDPGFARGDYEPWAAYGRSKTANILFAVELDRRLRSRGARAVAVHPGGIRTELARHLDPAMLEERIGRINAELAARGQPPFRLKSLEQGAATTVWAAFVADADAVGGRYCEDCGVAEPLPAGGAADEAISRGVRPYALDADRAAALWRLSERLTGETTDARPERGNRTARA